MMHTRMGIHDDWHMVETLCSLVFLWVGVPAYESVMRKVHHFLPISQHFAVSCSQHAGDLLLDLPRFVC